MNSVHCTSCIDILHFKNTLLKLEEGGGNGIRMLTVMVENVGILKLGANDAVSPPSSFCFLITI